MWIIYCSSIVKSDSYFTLSPRYSSFIQSAWIIWRTRNSARYAGLFLGPAGGWGPGPSDPLSGLWPLPSIVVIIVVVVVFVITIIVIIIITTMEHTHRTHSWDTHAKSLIQFVTQESRNTCKICDTIHYTGVPGHTCPNSFRSRSSRSITTFCRYRLL